MATCTISQVVQSGRPELIGLRRRLRSTHADREAFEAATEAGAIDESDRDIYDRLFTLFDKRGTDRVHVKTLLAGLAAIVNGTVDDRLCVAFELWDDRNTGKLEQKDVMAVLVAMNTTCACFGDAPLAYDRLEELVDSVFATYHQNQKVDYRAHAGDIARHPILEIFLVANNR